jgi:hypothetical protein
MPKFPKYDVAEMLGVTRISRVSDSEIWHYCITPNVKSLIGEVKSVEGPVLTESIHGFFPGDEATNLNNHRLYGGSTSDKVRFPYLNTIYRTQWGALVIKRDFVKFKVLAWYGDVDKGRGQLIYRSSLRDRRFDGTLRANETALLDFPFDDPAPGPGCNNKPLPGGLGVEVSMYGFLPGSKIVDVTGDQEYEDFVSNPYAFAGKTDAFLKHFRQAWSAGRSPGQVAAPIPDVSRLVAPLFEQLAHKHGYDYIENAASHYHVAMWSLSLSYRFSFQKQADSIRSLSDGIKRLKASGINLNRVQESWIVALQSLRPVEAIPQNLFLGGAEWPQNNLDQRNLWMNKPLHEKAGVALPGPLAD